MAGSPITRPLGTIAGLVLAAVLCVSANIVAEKTLPDARFDLTDRHLYTLSDSTRAVLSKIDEPITLDLYFSKTLGEQIPSYGVYAQEVRELLQQYAVLAKGKLHVRFLDPAPFSDTEDAATAAGLQGVPLDQSGTQVYFGLAGTNSTDDKQTIPFFQTDRERFVEYDLTKLIQQLASPNKKVIGLVTNLALEGDPTAAMRGQPSVPITIIQQLRKTYDVEDLSTTFDKVPDDVDMLMVVQPEHLPEPTRYAIDQFVLKGGHALVFADPNAEFATAHANPMQPSSGMSVADADDLLHAWGVDLTKGKVVGDRANAVSVNISQADKAPPMDYIGWINLPKDSFNHDDPVTAQLGQVTFGTAGALEPVKAAGTQFETLIQSSANAELIDAAKTVGIPDVADLLQSFKATGKRYTIAARVTGLAHTAFPNGVPKSDKALQNVAEVKVATQPINVIVVADADMLDDRFWVQTQDFFGQQVTSASADNGDFVANAVDNLAGSGDLIGLRARGSGSRPFTVVTAIKQRADDRYRAEQTQLQAKLKTAESQLADLAKEGGGDQTKLTPAERQSIDQMRATIVQTRQRLRQVQLALRQDIDALKTRLVALDVGLVPLLVALAALILSAARLNRRKRQKRVA